MFRLSVISALIYLSTKALKFSVGIPGWVDAYLTDVLCLPLILSLSLILLRWIFQRAEMLLTVPMIVFAWVVTSVLFEVVLPLKSDVYVADTMDVVAYGIGALIFFFLQKKIPTNSEKTAESGRDLSMKGRKYSS